MMGDKRKVDGCKKWDFCKPLIVREINALLVRMKSGRV